MTTDRKLQLAARVHANAQRRALEQFLKFASVGFREPLARAECIFSPEAHAVLKRVLPMTASQIGSIESTSLPGFQFITTGKPQRVLEQLQSLPSSSDFRPCILVLPGVEMINFSAGVECVPTYPLFRLRFGEARRILAGAWHSNADVAGAFADDFSAGIMIDSYAEYPAEDAGLEECTYEVARWASA